MSGVVRSCVLMLLAFGCSDADEELHAFVECSGPLQFRHSVPTTSSTLVGAGSEFRFTVRDLNQTSGGRLIGRQAVDAVQAAPDFELDAPDPNDSARAIAPLEPGT